jgi:uncharacterized protein
MNPRIRGLILLVTSSCNLACDYCYVSGTFSGDMDPKTAVAAVEQLRSVRHVAFGGGEPLSDLARLQTIHAALLDVPRRIDFSITTNGTLIDDATADWMASALSFVAVSFDGFGEAASAGRACSSGGDSCGAALAGICHLLERGVALSVAMTVSPRSLRTLAKSARELDRVGVRSIVLNVLQDGTWTPGDYDILAGQLGQIVAERDGLSVRVDPLERALFASTGSRQVSECPGSIAVTLLPSGVYLPCDAFLAQEGGAPWVLGSVDSGIDLPRLAEARSMVSPDSDACKVCLAADSCDRGCACTYILARQHSGVDSEEWCEFHRAIAMAARVQRD